METLQALATRKSIRCYLNQSVEQEKIDKILQAANQAPVAGEFRITVVRNPELLRQINNATLDAMKNSGNEFLMSRANLEGYQPLYGAPVLIVLSSKPTVYSQINTACSATNMVNAATALGLGSCFIVSPTLVLQGDDEYSRKIGIPEGNKPLCCVLIGYVGEGSGFQSRRPAVDNINFVD